MKPKDIRSLVTKSCTDRHPLRRFCDSRLLGILAVAMIIGVVVLSTRAPGLAQAQSGDDGGYGAGDGEAYGEGDYGGMGYGGDMGHDEGMGYGRGMGYGGDPYGEGYAEEGMDASGRGWEGAQELRARLQPIMQRLRRAKDDKQKATVKGELLRTLDSYFEKDMQWRTNKLNSIQDRISRLQNQLDQRREAKDEILQLQSKVLENEAAGLGFYAQPSTPFDSFSPTSEMGADLGSFAPREPVPPPFEQAITVDLLETPLVDVVEFLRSHGDANIYLDQRVFKKASVSLQSPVTLSLKDVPMVTVLELVADSLSDEIGTRFEDGVAILGSRKRPTRAATSQWGTDGAQTSRRVLERLSDTADYSFIDVPLVDAVNYLQQLTEANVFVNYRTLKCVDVTADSAISVDLKNVKHRMALRLILASLNESLYYSIVDGVIVISTEQRGRHANVDPFGSATYGGGMGPFAADEAYDEMKAEEPAIDPQEPPPEVGSAVADAVSDRVLQSPRLPVSGAEQLALLEVEVSAAASKLQLVKTAWEQGQTGALEHQAAQASFGIAKQKLAKARREFAAQQTLLELDLAGAQARLNTAESELQNVQQLADGAAVSQAELRKHESAVEQMKLAVQRAKILLELHCRVEDENSK